MITGAALGDRGEISDQPLAFASILYYANKSSAQFAFEEILNSAEYPEGRIYAAMGLYNFGGKSVIDNLLKNADKSRIVSVLIGSKMHEVQLGKFFETFLRDTSLFIPDISILRRTTTIQNTRYNKAPKTSAADTTKDLTGFYSLKYPYRVVSADSPLLVYACSLRL